MSEKNYFPAMWELQKVCQAYQVYLKKDYKTNEEIKDEEIKVKPILPSYCGKNIDFYA